MFETIYFDITGGCNAKCPLCVTARTTFGKRIEHISREDFGRTLDRLLDLGLAEPGRSTIKLYSWGEPILHPDLDGIVQTVADRALNVGISTNASKRTSFTVSTAHFTEMVFSAPGWSQASYDRIHGLKFERVVANIEATMENMRTRGYKGPFTLSFHVYQFNIVEELPLAREWCRKNGVVLQAYAAYINDYEPNIRYRNGTLSRQTLHEISKRLLLYYVDDLIESQPEDWRCPQWESILTLNHKSEVVLCCVLPPGHESYSIGSVFDLSREEILARKTTDKECDNCLGCGVAYWAHNPKMIELRQPKSTWVAGAMKWLKAG